MATVLCPRCKTHVSSVHHLKTLSGVAIGATSGAYMGAGLGLVAGPLGGMAGTIPGAVIGGLLVALGVQHFLKCPACRKVFMA